VVFEPPFFFASTIRLKNANNWLYLANPHPSVIVAFQIHPVGDFFYSEPFHEMQAKLDPD
jgi:hypothetical protein